MTNPILINPTLPQNIAQVIALANKVYGINPGKLEAYKIYSLPSQDGERLFYALTHPVLQFISDPSVNSNIPLIRWDVIEPTTENHGDFGNIYPVIKSIISNNGHTFFDDSGSYVVKKLFVDQQAPSDKPNKPNLLVRMANREQYLGSQHPTLGINYQLIIENKVSYLHMNRAPGLPLVSYREDLSGEQFLSLVCTLLEEVPKQIHQIVNSGKRKGRVIIHCDLKPENIMAEWKNDKWTVTVIDMGFAKAINKDEHYSTRRSYGNSLVWDGDMVRAEINQEPKHYDIQSDLYALFVSITELAGAPSRDELESDEDFLADIEDPDLTGIFNNMQFDSITQKQLTDILRQALCSNKMQRATLEEVLPVFQKALNKIQQNKSEVKLLPPSVEKIEVTAQDLKAWVELPLNKIILDKEKTGQNKRITLKLWLNRFHQLRSLANEEENERFNSLLTHKIDLCIRSSYISDFLRFNLINEYNNEACIRLLFRHIKLTASLENEYPLPEHWKKRFQMLVNYLPLQLTTAQAAQCKELNLLKQNISDFLTQNNHQKFSLSHLMHMNLEAQLKMEVGTWVTQLPEFARVFNQQIACMEQLEKLNIKLIPVCSFTKDLQQQFDNLKDKIISDASQGILPDNFYQDFEHYFRMIEVLNDYIGLYNDLLFLFTVFPDLTLSTLGLGSIKKELQSLQINDQRSVVTFTQKIELLLLVNDTYTQITNPDYLSYDCIVKVYGNKLTELINQFVNHQCQEQELKANLEHIIEFFDGLRFWDAFIDGCCQFPHIQKAVRFLLDNNFEIMKLMDVVDADFKSGPLTRLDRRLETLLSQELEPSLLGEKLLLEISKYFAAPRKYFLPDPKYYSQANTNNMFLTPATSEKKKQDSSNLVLGSHVHGSQL